MLMENLRPKSLSARNRTRWAGLSTMAMLAVAASTSYAQTGLPELQTDMPITIDAESSEFDYETSRLVFHGLRMDQGNLGIEADVAETDKLDFTNGLWIFTGNVIIEAENAKLFCDEAKLTFINHQLITAELSGTPARFEQVIEEPRQTNSGEANNILYKLDTGKLELREDARFSDGANEISGDLITYDIAAKHITAGSGSSGPVKILIEPPSQLKEKKLTP
jgi:lipopolysaccharide transport protein LptA